LKFDGALLPSSCFFSYFHLNNQTMSVVRRFISIVVLASLPLATNSSLAYTFPFDPSAPSILKIPSTGTGFGTAAKNQMFLSNIFQGYNITGGSYTSQGTPWVAGQNVIVSQIPYVEGEVSWNSILNTWVSNGIRYFTGNGVPNHPTGQFPLANNPSQDAYPWYAALPDPAGLPNASYLQIEEYDLYMAVPQNPVYSNTPTAIGELTFAISTQTGATFQVNLTKTDDQFYADPIAALPGDQCFGNALSSQYHYSGYSWKCFPDQGDANEHSPLFGYALDGFGVFGPRGDGGVLLTNDDLDVCHGHSGKIDWDGILSDMYHYHLNNEYPYGAGCYRGTQIGTFSSNGDPSATAAVPGPVPVLGALAALRYSRRLKKRSRPQATHQE